LVVGLPLSSVFPYTTLFRSFDLGVHLLERDGRGARPLRFLTMELLPGETLAHRIEQRGPLGEAETRRIATQLAAGLAAAHRAGVDRKSTRLNSSHVKISYAV